MQAAVPWEEHETSDEQAEADDDGASAKMDGLARGEISFERWVRSFTEGQKVSIVKRHFGDSVQ